MKLHRLSEEIKHINSKDMENWDVKSHFSKIKKPNKPLNFNEDRGRKVHDLLNKYGLCVLVVGTGDYCEKQGILLPGEEELVEYRVSYGKLKDVEDQDEEDIIEKLEEFDWDNFNTNNFDEELFIDLSDDGRVEHSVFLPANLKASGNRLAYIALDWATEYLHKLNNYPSVIEGDTESYPFSSNPKQFVNWINSHNMVFTNENLEKIPDVENRLYKDSKFFNLFEQAELPMKLFAEWTNIK